MCNRLLILLLSLWTCASLASAAPGGVEITIKLSSGTAVASQRYPAGGDTLVLWLTGQYGEVPQEQAAATYLAEQGMETWLTDWIAPYFLPQLPSSIAQVPTADLTDWLAAVMRRQPHKRILLLASAHATAWPLRALNGVTQRAAGSAVPVDGVLLLWPLLYRDAEPGEAPQYDTVVGHTRANLLILVPMASAGYWWRERLQAAFEAAGSRVRLEVLPGLRDGFYRRPDANAQEQAEGRRLGEILAPRLQSFGKALSP